MISFWCDRFRRQTWHPSFEDLMLYLDGELGSKGNQIENHTKHCWSCRLRLEKIDRAISEFMEARNSSFVGSSKLPRRASLNFSNKLTRLEVECGSPNFLSGLMHESTGGLFGLKVSAGSLIFVALLGLLVVAILRLSLTPPVSASELLERAQAAQSVELRSVQTPVLHQRLRVRRKVTGSTQQAIADYDLWNDHSQGRFRQTGASTQVLSDLRQTYETNGLDWLAPLSAIGYARWRDSLPAKEDFIAKEKASLQRDTNAGPEPLALTTVVRQQDRDFSPTEESQRNRIIKAELVVRTADWHPVEQRLWVDDWEYTIAELDYKVLPLSEVDPSVFAEPAAPVKPVEAPRPVMTELPAGLVPPLPDPDETEMAVRYGLHQLDADLGEPIEITRDRKGKVIVEAWGVAPELQAKLKEQVASLPNAGLELNRTASSDCAACLAPSQDAAEKSPSQSLTFAPPINPNEKRLEEILGGSNAQESFTQEVLAISGDALSHGFALRNLALRYPAEEEAKLTPIAKAQLKEMVDDHVAVLIERTNRLQRFLRPLLEALSNNRAPDVRPQQVAANSAPSDHTGKSVGTGLQRGHSVDSTSSPWQNASFEILAEVQKVDQLIETLLPRTINPMPADQVVPNLRQALSKELQDLNHYRGVVSPVKTIDK